MTPDRGRDLARSFSDRLSCHVSVRTWTFGVRSCHIRICCQENLFFTQALHRALFRGKTQKIRVAATSNNAEDRCALRIVRSLPIPAIWNKPSTNGTRRQEL